MLKEQRGSSQYNVHARNIVKPPLTQALIQGIYNLNNRRPVSFKSLKGLALNW